MYLYVNGEYKKQDELHISPFDHGFLYGIGAFETLRTYNGHPFLLYDHIDRLNAAVRELGIDFSLSYSEAEQIIRRLLELNHLNNAYIRINVSAGAEELGLSAAPYKNPVLIFFIKELNLPERLTKQGVILSVRRNTPEGSFRIKSHHFLNNVLAKREIGDHPKTEGIFLTHSGYVAEGIVSNIFWVKNNTVYTPAVSTGILNGITRQFVLTILEKHRIPYEEGLYPLDHLLSAQEVFITNSLQEIVPITHIGQTAFAGEQGILTNRLITIYKKVRQHILTRSEFEVGDEQWV